MNNNLIDISRMISNDAIVYPGDDPIQISTLCSIAPDCPCNIMTLGGWTTHFLTHVDPPLHFVENGDSLDQIPLNRFMGEALVVEVHGDAVLPSHIPPSDKIKGINLLFKTRNSEIVASTVFDENHVYVSAEAAKIIVERHVNLVGIDYIGIDRYGDKAYPVHRTLLPNNVLILEGLDLSKVQPGYYTFMALPLRIVGADGSPVRAVLIPKE
jgi:arylformamidase